MKDNIHSKIGKWLMKLKDLSEALKDNKQCP